MTRTWQMVVGEPSRNCNNCVTTQSQAMRPPGSGMYNLIALQHTNALRAVEAAGVELIRFDTSAHADGLYVCDTAIIDPCQELAIEALMGTESRKDEVLPFRRFLETQGVKFLQIPKRFDVSRARIEGGDVVFASNGDGKKFMIVGAPYTNGGRTNDLGRKILKWFCDVTDREFVLIPFDPNPCLHMGTGLEHVGVGKDGRIVFSRNPKWVQVVEALEQYNFDIVDLGEGDDPWAPNVLNLPGRKVLMQNGAPILKARLEERGFSVVIVDFKGPNNFMDGSLTCCFQQKRTTC